MQNEREKLYKSTAGACYKGPCHRKFFPRTLNARLRSIARLDAEYTQQEYNTCFEAVLKEFDLKPNEKANKNQLYV